MNEEEAISIKIGDPVRSDWQKRGRGREGISHQGSDVIWQMERSNRRERTKTKGFEEIME